jgi:hypothetical protein
MIFYFKKMKYQNTLFQEWSMIIVDLATEIVRLTISKVMRTPPRQISLLS